MADAVTRIVNVTDHPRCTVSESHLAAPVAHLRPSRRADDNGRAALGSGKTSITENLPINTPHALSGHARRVVAGTIPMEAKSTLALSSSVCV